MATHSSTLAWKIPWTVMGYSLWGGKESDTTECACAHTHTHTHTHTHIKAHYWESEKTTHRMGKISTNYISDTRLISRIYKVLLHLNNTKWLTQIQKQRKNLNELFSRRDKWPKGTWKGTASAIRKCKSTLRWHATSQTSGRLVSEASRTQVLDVEKLEPSSLAGQKVKWYSHC